MINLDKLSEYLKKSDASMIILSFHEIENILESELPLEAKHTAKWWWNVKYSKKAKSWLDYGYETHDHQNIPARGSICFRRIEKKPKYEKGFSRIWYFLTDMDAELHQKAMAVLEISVMPILAILTLYFTMFPYRSPHQARTDFANLISEGNYALENSNFLEAADYYHKASSISYDIYSEAFSQHREGICYMLYGLSENDKNYQKRALLILENLVDTSRYNNTLAYQEALTGLCSLYNALDYDPQDAKWCSIVQKLETMFSFDDLESISAENMPTFISAATNLSYYYETIIYSDFNSFLFREDCQDKAIYYSQAAIQLGKKYDEYQGVKSYDQSYLISTYELTSYMIANALTNSKNKDSFLETLEEARTLCQDAISAIDLESGNMFQLNIYIELKRNIGEAYFFSSGISESPNKEDYMLKAYQELIRLFYWNYYEVSENVMCASNNVLSTGLCTEDDIQLILERFSSYLQTAHEGKDIPAQINIELTGLAACNAILLHYDYETVSFNAKRFGQQLYVDLNTALFDFLDNNQKETLAKYSKGFGT